MKITTTANHETTIVPENHAGAVPVAAASEPMAELIEEPNAQPINDEEAGHG